MGKSRTAGRFEPAARLFQALAAPPLSPGSVALDTPILRVPGRARWTSLSPPHPAQIRFTRNTAVHPRPATIRNPETNHSWSCARHGNARHTKQLRPIAARPQAPQCPLTPGLGHPLRHLGDAPGLDKARAFDRRVGNPNVAKGTVAPWSFLS